MANASFISHLLISLMGSRPNLESIALIPTAGAIGQSIGSKAESSNPTIFAIGVWMLYLEWNIVFSNKDLFYERLIKFEYSLGMKRAKFKSVLFNSVFVH